MLVLEAPPGVASRPGLDDGGRSVGLILLERKGMMAYDELPAIGAPIATGVIENACRHLINDRMDLTGERWRLPSAEAVLRWRSLLSSGDFDDYWPFHESSETTYHVTPLARCRRSCCPLAGRIVRLVGAVD